MKEEPYTLGTPQEPPSASDEVMRPPARPMLTALQTMMFAAMWIPSMLAFILAVVALVLEMENLLLMGS